MNSSSAKSGVAHPRLLSRGAWGAGRIFISAAHKSSGKTTLSIGLAAALRARGLAVQPFKKGPDYIDPMWLSAASGRTCRNLDFYLMPPEEIVSLFKRASSGADVVLIEGNKGLHDGLHLDGHNSSAALAKLLDAPVVLVIDTNGMTRGVAPLLLGYRAFDPQVCIGGVILNSVAGPRHESKLRQAVEHFTDIPVLGAVRRSDRLSICERHLGLVPSNELGEARMRIAEIGRIVAEQVDLDRLSALARSACAPLPNIATLPVAGRGRERGIRIGVARDRAFSFYYPDDMEALEALGAQLVFVDLLHDAYLPQLDGLFIGGGFPELFMSELEANRTMREDVRRAVEAGLPTYAECGGLMYLSRSISWKGRSAAMAAVVQADVVMSGRPVGRGYVRLKRTVHDPWPLAGPSAPEVIAGHEFHYSKLENLAPGYEFAYGIERGFGIDGRHDGIVYKNLLASYSHLRSLSAHNWTARFAAHVRRTARPWGNTYGGERRFSAGSSEA